MDNHPLPSEQARYSDLFQRLLDPTFLLDTDAYTILDANDACEPFFELEKDQIINSSVFDWIKKDHQAPFIKALRIARRRYYPRQFEFEWKMPGGKEVITDIVACVLNLNNDQDVIQIIARDITKQKESERKANEYLKQLEELNQRLEALSVTDELTQAANFRRFKEELDQEHERAKRYQTPYSIIFCDVDHFKNYNDVNGHPAGDEVLKNVARLIRENSRETDLPARYGGEEFAILCPEIRWSDAITLAERIRSIIEAYPFAHRENQPGGRVSLSIGVASFPENGRTAAQVLEAADEAVYHSKEHGRNQVTAYSWLER